jgi:dethiobiotin synthetase
LGLKPVESGTEDNEGVPADAGLLARCCGAEPEHCIVYALPEPLAPVLAARRAGVSIDITRLDAAFEAACVAHEFVVVEGVGGARVEVAPGVDVADLAARWRLATLVVAANRLGVLSHTLLTVEALQRRNVPVLGVVLNNVDVRSDSQYQYYTSYYTYYAPSSDVEPISSSPKVAISMGASPTKTPSKPEEDDDGLSY